MSEADWWLCRRCNSLNNLAARKCYSCRERKPKDAARASEVLEYVPEISWDGKVKFHGRPEPEPDPDLDVVDEPSAPPQIREPVRRDILAVAPRLPNPAKITYSLVEPPPPPPAAPVMPDRPMAAPGPAAAGPSPLPDPPVGPGPLPAPPVGPGPPQPGEPGPPAWLVEVSASPQPPVVAVGPGEPPVVAVGPGEPPPLPGEAEMWPHWRDLLDGPTPDADRLRSATEAHSSVGAVGTTDGAGGQTLNEAIRQARLTRAAESRSFIPWPTSDRAPAEPEGPDEQELPVEADQDGRHE